MTTEPKLNNKCPKCEGKKFIFVRDAIERLPISIALVTAWKCPLCHGLVKVFAPGDSLTAKEAFTIWKKYPTETRFVHSQKSIWKPTKESDFTHTKSLEFRLGFGTPTGACREGE